jgi:uncharacterized protein
MPTHADALAVMAKAPIPGLVKTRLIPFFSADEAAELARALLIDQLNHLKAISAVDLYLAFTPQETGSLMRELAPSEFTLFPQTEGDLGVRMMHVFEILFAKGHKRIVLIGSDLPPVPLAYFTQAFAYLEGKKSPFHPPLAKGERGGFAGSQQRVVLGPARDGGYYLVGLNLETPEIFAEMTWSDNRVLTNTLKRLSVLGSRTLQLPTWFDIDTPEDVQSLSRERVSYENDMKNTFGMLDRLEGRQKRPGEGLLRVRTKS